MRKNFSCSLILLLFVLKITTMAQTTSQTSIPDNLIFGVGYGVFTICFGIVVGLLLCLFARATSAPG